MRTRRPLACALRAVAVALLTSLATADPAAAQVLDRPADERPELPGFPTAEPRAPLQLEPVTPVPSDAPLSRGPHVFVRRFRVEGCTVFTPEEIEEVLRPWIGRTLDTSDLQDAADALTRRYTDAGYAGSGALIPDQEVADGVITLRVVEARLADVIVVGNRFQRSGQLRRRLLAQSGTPVNLNQVEESLQLLLEEPAIERVAGELRPGAAPGETVLVLRIEERFPLRAAAVVANDRPPPVGEWAGHALFGLSGPSGWGDSLDLDLEFTEGLDAQEARYAIPFTGLGSTFELLYRRTASEIVEDFEDLGIESETHTAGIGVAHPLLRSPRQQLWLRLRGEWRQNQTRLLDRDFSFEPGAEHGLTRVAVLRAIQDYSRRSRSDVIAVRSTASFGLDALGATTHTHLPDGRFVAWLLQLQWAHRLPEAWRSTQLILRSDLQLADDPLLTLERFAIGGRYTVRGYRENRLVRDEGAVGSLELRVPLLRDLFGSDALELAPFVDVGYGWNHDAGSSPNTLASAGLGLRYRLADLLDLEAYWGEPLNHVERPGSTLEDDGIHLRLRLRSP